MRGCKKTGHAFVASVVGGVSILILAAFARASHGSGQIGGPLPYFREYGVDALIGWSRSSCHWLVTWYARTAPADRVIWGGLTACAGMGFVVLWDRLIRLRPKTIMPRDFAARFLDRLHEGKLDCGQALDHCERNPSPAARVAMAAVRRWGRPAADLERAVALAHKVETERLRKNVGSLRRIAALAPLLGLLGTLFAAERALLSIPSQPTVGIATAGLPAAEVSNRAVAWGPDLATALSPLTAGIIIATLALVAYDGLATRIESLAGALDRLGAETIDAIALSAPIATPTLLLTGSSVRPSTTRSTAANPAAPARTPHQSRVRRNEEAEPR